MLDELEAYLRCGIPVHGFLRVRCREGKDRQLTLDHLANACIAKALPVIAHQASQNLNDIRYSALAYTFVRNVCAHGWDGWARLDRTKNRHFATTIGFQDHTYLWDFVHTQATEEAQDNDKTKGSKPQTEYAIFHAKYLNNNASQNQPLELLWPHPSTEQRGRS